MGRLAITTKAHRQQEKVKPVPFTKIRRTGTIAMLLITLLALLLSDYLDVALAKNSAPSFGKNSTVAWRNNSRSILGRNSTPESDSNLASTSGNKSAQGLNSTSTQNSTQYVDEWKKWKLDKYHRRVCTTSDCKHMAFYLQHSMNKEKDPCEDWEQFMCGKFGKSKHINYAIEADQDKANYKVKNHENFWQFMEPALGNPYNDIHEVKSPEGADVETFNKMRNYFTACMDGWNNNLVGLRPLKRIIDMLYDSFARYEERNPVGFGNGVPRVNTSKPLDEHDFETLENSIFTLGQYGIPTFAKIFPQRSLFHHGKMTVMVTPYTTTGWPLSKYYQDENKDRFPRNMANYLDNKPIKKEYHGTVEGWLKEAYKGQDDWYAPDISKLAEQVIEMEREIHALAPPVEQWRKYKENVKEVSLKELRDMIPQLRLDKVVLRYPVDEKLLREDGKPWIDKVDVMFPEYWESLSKKLRSFSRETIRAYYFWQVFKHGFDVLNHPLAEKYKSVLLSFTGKKKKESLRSECRAKTLDMFAHINGAEFVRSTIGPQLKRKAELYAAAVKEEFEKIMEETPWLQKEEKAKALDKAKSVNVEVAYPEKSPNYHDWSQLKAEYEGAEVKHVYNTHDWTFGDDYFELEKWRTLKPWKNDLANPPDSYRWHQPAWGQDPDYAHLENLATLPSGLLWEPLFGNRQPAYANFAGFGTAAGYAVARSFDDVGVTLSADGVLDNRMSPESAAEHHNRSQCFHEKYVMDVRANHIKSTKDPKKQTPYFPLNTDMVMGGALADTYGMEAAYRAWNTYLKRRPQEPRIALEGFEEYSDKQMFFMMRSMHYCGRERKEVLTGHLATSNDLPDRVRVWAPMRDSKAWHDAFGCQPKKPICRIWGKDVDE
ncbi:hypothetical protein G7046_g8481 [Stylonectria norvegica]|nr:hypothetical protein G7046_g8481 [Stylonectria norvegica]